MKRQLLCLYLLIALNVQAAPANPASAINQDVDKLVALYTDGFGITEPGMRHVIFGALFEAEAKDAVVFFTLAGVDLMNGYEEYIAIFSQGKGRSTPVAKERPFRLVASAQIGTRWARTLDWHTARISPGQIVVQGKRWGNKDAGCCPTEPIEVTFTIRAADGGETTYPLLREVEKPAQRADKLLTPEIPQ
jgi:hypothetical protein